MIDGIVAAPLVRRLTLRNIGPFERLELDLDRAWTVILGNNGVGKSTILRAMAAALMAGRAAPHVQRLLKAGASDGDITLDTAASTYRTTMVRHAHGVRIESSASAPIADIEGWPALGVPAVRIVSGGTSDGAARAASGRAEAADLVSLATGEADVRFERLKQWLVTLDYRAHMANAAEERGRLSGIRDAFFALVAMFAPEIRFHSVDLQTMALLVATDDGIVPLEDVSQGSASLFGWVGLVFQRLHETCPEDPRPSQRSALILIDEIDAHLHPGRQQTLVGLLRTAFPSAQFVATTHSPLVAAALQPDQLRRLQRHEGTGQIAVTMPDTRIGDLTVDQVLTSQLFGIRDTRSIEALGTIERYAALLGKTARTEVEQAEFTALGKQLLASHGDREEVQRAIDRAARDAVLAVLEGKDDQAPFSGLRPEVVRDVISRITQRFSTTGDARQRAPFLPSP